MDRMLLLVFSTHQKRCKRDTCGIPASSHVLMPNSAFHQRSSSDLDTLAVLENNMELQCAYYWNDYNTYYILLPRDSCLITDAHSVCCFMLLVCESTRKDELAASMYVFREF